MQLCAKIKKNMLTRSIKTIEPFRTLNYKPVGVELARLPA